MNIEETKEAIHVMQAYVDGKDIEILGPVRKWEPVNCPRWAWGDTQYRIKPTQMGGIEMSDTPRTDEQINGKPCTRFEILAGDCLRNAAVPSEFARQLERELTEANERIKRLEEALERLFNLPNDCCCQLSNSSLDAWNNAHEALKAMEAKP